MMRTTVVIANLTCEHCKNTVEAQLKKVVGISNISINIKKSKVSFDYKTHNTLEGLRMDLEAIGFPITKDPSWIP